jgi:ferredoxin
MCGACVRACERARILRKDLVTKKLAALNMKVKNDDVRVISDKNI